MGSSASGELTVTNESDFAIVEMHVTPVNNASWGPNLLGNHVLLPGDATLVNTSCDVFDVLLVDDQGVDCQVDNVDLCLNAADFVINNDTCTVFGAAR
jgi:hypothetical protein